MRISKSLPVPAIVAVWCLACGGGADSGEAVVGGDGVNDAAPAGPSGADDGPVFSDDEERVQIQEGGACADDLAATTFARALCTCTDARVAGYLRTGSVRSGAPPAGADASSPSADASVGVNGDYATAGYAEVAGDFVVAGSEPVAFGGLLSTEGDLGFHPSFSVAGVLDVGRDARLAGDVSAFGRVRIGGDLQMSPEARFTGIALVDVGGSRLDAAVEVAPPCACESGELLDVAALVDEARRDNDNADLSLAADAAVTSVGIGRELRLPTGRFYLERLGGLGSLDLVVAGKTALFVGGDVIATGLFRVRLEPDAELDVFVGGDLRLTGAALLGDAERPASSRWYVAGEGEVTLAGFGSFVGNLYAPAADVLIGGYGRVQGSLFARSVTAAGFLDLGYDSSIRDGSPDCPSAEREVPRIR